MTRGVRIEGDLVVLRPIRRREIPARVRAYLADPFVATGRRRNPQSLRRRYERSGRWNGGRLDLAIEADDRVVGTIQAWRGWSRGLPPGVAEVGIGVSEAPDRRRGYGAEATRLLSGWLLENGIARVQASTEVANVAARRALEKAGFTFEGVLRAYFPADGRGRADYAMYAIVTGTG